MENLLANIKIKVAKELFISDPASSKLGQKILSRSIELLVEIGFEKFTFKKLGQEIGSPEASIYRYFKNKNQLLSYLISWYWGWMEYRLVFETSNVSSPTKKLEKSIALITSNSHTEGILDGVNTGKLHQIIISESIKSYLSKEVDQFNEDGAYMNYKKLVERITKTIKEINPRYKYPQMLITTIVEGAHLQTFFGEHLPRLTNKQTSPDFITKFYIQLAQKSINS